MWSKEVTLKTKSSKADIWKLWTNVSDWNKWDNQVIESQLNGEFKLGQKGSLQPKGGPKSNFELTEVTPEKSFTSRSKLPMAKMDFIHTLSVKDGETIITHRIEISGWTSFLFSRVIGNKLIKELPSALDKLDALAQNKNI